MPPPNRIVSVREERYKLARYFDADGGEPDQWEMYDLQEDAAEKVNLAHSSYSASPEQEAARARLTARLAEVVATRLQPLPTD